MKIPWRREWLPIPVFLSGKSHGQRSLVDYSLWGCKELDTIEHAHTTHSRQKRWNNQYSGYLIYISFPLGSLRSPTAGTEKTRTQEVIWRRLASPLLLGAVLPPATRGTLLPSPLSSGGGWGGLVLLCKMCVMCVCVCVFLCKMSIRHLVQKTFGPHQRALKLFPIQNILEHI